MATPYRVVFNEQQISAQRVAKHMRHLCYADLCAESCKTHASSMLCRSLRRELLSPGYLYLVHIYERLLQIVGLFCKRAL